MKVCGSSPGDTTYVGLFVVGTLAHRAETHRYFVMASVSTIGTIDANRRAMKVLTPPRDGGAEWEPCSETPDLSFVERTRKDMSRGLNGHILHLQLWPTISRGRLCSFRRNVALL